MIARDFDHDAKKSEWIPQDFDHNLPDPLKQIQKTRGGTPGLYYGVQGEVMIEKDWVIDIRFGPYRFNQKIL